MSEASKMVAELARQAAADVIRLELDARYVSAECQWGAHHGCPGGIGAKNAEGLGVRLYCHCPLIGCDCHSKQLARQAIQAERAEQDRREVEGVTVHQRG